MVIAGEDRDTLTTKFSIGRLAGEEAHHPWPTSASPFRPGGHSIINHTRHISLSFMKSVDANRKRLNDKYSCHTTTADLLVGAAERPCLFTDVIKRSASNICEFSVREFLHAWRELFDVAVVTNAFVIGFTVFLVS